MLNLHKYCTISAVQSGEPFSYFASITQDAQLRQSRLLPASTSNRIGNFHLASTTARNYRLLRQLLYYCLLKVVCDNKHAPR